jgi:hypothetical protein
MSENKDWKPTYKAGDQVYYLNREAVVDGPCMSDPGWYWVTMKSGWNKGQQTAHHESVLDQIAYLLERGVLRSAYDLYRPGIR